MNQEINELIEIIENFHENYQAETVSDFPVNFSNDTLLLIKEFKNNASNENASELKKVYEDFMSKILKHAEILKEHQSFDFNEIKTFESLISNSETKRSTSASQFPLTAIILSFKLFNIFTVSLASCPIGISFLGP